MSEIRLRDYPRAAITGVILAGGRALRMGGQDKGLLMLSGRPMAAYAVAILRPQVGELLINANRNVEAYQALNCPVVNDSVGRFFGPLAGMLAAMDATDSSFVLSVPCDSPLLSANYAERMYESLVQGKADLSVAYDGKRLQPVFALLKTTLRNSLQAYLEEGERKIDQWFARHRMTKVNFADQPSMFRNINTPTDLMALEAEIGSLVKIH